MISDVKKFPFFLFLTTKPNASYFRPHSRNPMANMPCRLWKRTPSILSVPGSDQQSMTNMAMDLFLFMMYLLSSCCRRCPTFTPGEKTEFIPTERKYCPFEQYLIAYTLLPEGRRNSLNCSPGRKVRSEGHVTLLKVPCGGGDHWTLLDWINAPGGTEEPSQYLFSHTPRGLLWRARAVTGTMKKYGQTKNRPPPQDAVDYLRLRRRNFSNHFLECLFAKNRFLDPEALLT